MVSQSEYYTLGSGASEMQKKIIIIRGCTVWFLLYVKLAASECWRVLFYIKEVPGTRRFPLPAKSVHDLTQSF
jgi:hypothetical protein